MVATDFPFKPRKHRDIPLWRRVTNSQWYDPQWQDQNSIKDVDKLARIIKLSASQQEAIDRVITEMRAQGKEEKESMWITPYYAALMAANPFRPRYPDGETLEGKLDPIFWQSVPTPANLLFPGAGLEEAMAESERSYGAFYQRYPNRGALFVADISSCASYCQHCQRRKSLDETCRITLEDINKGLYYISENQNINEVLVTGGDALRISNSRLKYVLEELSRISHVKLIRIATRVPVVMPMAITDEILELIGNAANKHVPKSEVKKNVYFVTHTNHYHEITKEYTAAIERIKMHGFTVLNQTVLLNHVNADFETLAHTFTRMWWAGTKPYYLLQCHKEKGLAHFITPILVGKININHLQGVTSGTAMPRYAMNILKGGGKVNLMPTGYLPPETGMPIEEEPYSPYAKVYTWDGNMVPGYEALGRATETEYRRAIRKMREFTDRSGIFKPSLIIVNKDDEFVGIRNVHLPRLTTSRKAELLGYVIHEGEPLTNPAEISKQLDEGFRGSRFYKKRSKI